MLSSIFQFYRQHKRRIFWTIGSLVSGSFAVWLFLQKRARDLEYQQNLIKQRIKKKYQQTQKDCMYTILALLPPMASSVYALAPVEAITKQLLSKRKRQSDADADSDGGAVSNSNSDANKESKPVLWDELKLKSLARVLAIVYCECMLTLLVKLQLNMVARKDYFRSQLEAAGASGVINSYMDASSGAAAPELEFLVEQSYLSLSWWLLNNGYKMVYDKCEEAVSHVFANVSVKTELTFNEFSVRVAKAQEMVDKSFLGEVWGERLFLNQCMMPPEDLETAVLGKNVDDEAQVKQIVESDGFRVLVEETKEYINTEAMNVVLVAMVTTTLSRFLNNCSGVIFEQEGVFTETEAELELVTKRFKLVKILSVIIKESNRLSDSSNGNEYVSEMAVVEDLEEFIACVYSNFAV